MKLSVVCDVCGERIEIVASNFVALGVVIDELCELHGLGRCIA
jgi:hypothetical protein